ncbi:alpha/beta hydrolase family protein [Arsenicicoccus dermatophilus]|uniref:alpha/beta hydrolase family protein n=1 Tax=Arsenicicoccus dermatophilus TaxID=1076331 RepID=UPI003916F776
MSPTPVPPSLSAVRRHPRATMVIAATGALAAGAATGWLGAAVYLAKKVLTPDRRRPDDTEVVAFDDRSVTLTRTAETVVPGRYGLFQDGGATHVRFGRILREDHARGTVTRRLHGVDAGSLRIGPARFHPYYYATDPQTALGIPTREVSVPGEVGVLPSWLVPPPSGEPRGTRWAVLVHGRGAGREETVRAVPSLHAAGLTCLIPSYRNDTVAPASADGLYGLGLSEWRDVDAAVAHAVAMGASDVVLVGWSMGGAIVLQTLVCSPYADHVSQVILDGPVVDWPDVLHHHARAMRVPGQLTTLSLRLLGLPHGRHLVGHADTLDLSATDMVHRAAELRHPILLIHSVDDEFVPSGRSEALAEARPDLVRLERWHTARHCKEWNVDRERWERCVTEFVTEGARPAP